MRRRIHAVLVAIAIILPARPVLAHEYWLSPSNLSPSAGDTVVVRTFVGTGFRGEARLYAPRRALAFRLESNRSIDLRPGGLNGDLEWARCVVADGGGANVTYVSDDASIELPAQEFDRYLALEGLDGPRAARAKLGAAAGPGRERYRRSCRAWLEGTETRRVTRAYGLPLELVPAEDPVRTSTPTFRVLYEGKPLAGALVRAWRQPLGPGGTLTNPASRDSVGPVASGHTDEHGDIQLALPGDGEWLVSTVHMVAVKDDPTADWRSTWASFVFARMR